jgi:dCMP deaminase
MDFYQKRPSWDDIFMEITETISKRSSCLKLQTGALLVRDNRIVSVGYNGTSPSLQNCPDYWFQYWEKSDDWRNLSFSDFLETDFFREKHHEWAVLNEIHGEQNAILFAAKEGIITKGATMYSLYSPCYNCAKMIVTAGILKVYYKYVYRRGKNSLEYFSKNGIECLQISVQGRKKKDD